MELIDKNDALIPKVWIILDSELFRIDIHKEHYKVNIDLYFKIAPSRPNAKRLIKLCFADVYEYDFAWDDKYTFYTIERFKFLRSAKGYFLSTDPYDESETILEEDYGFVHSREVAGYFLE